MELNAAKRLTETDDYESEVPILKQLQQPKVISADQRLPTTQNETFLEYYFQTMAGYSDGRTKTNQDAYYINTCLKRSSKCSLFAVFDGHGPLGHRVSEHLKKTLTESIEARFDPDNEYNLNEYTSILEAVCVDINTKLTNNRAINSLFSGSTGIIVLMHNDWIVCANVGDSRAGIIKEEDGSYVSLHRLSKDHTPADHKEKERVIRAGGKVHPCQGRLLVIQTCRETISDRPEYGTVQVKARD